MPTIRQQIRELAQYNAKLPEIEAAQDELEAYRDEYERLTHDPKEYMRRAKNLFNEPSFKPMRFSEKDLELAFEVVGYPPATDGLEFVLFARRVVDFLVDDDERIAMARRLICIMPDYVKKGRYLDAWIIQHNFILLCDPPERG